MSTESEGYLSFGVGMILGVGIGAALGLLLAPSSGRETRSELRDLAHNVPGSLNHNIDDTKDRCINFIDKTKYSFEKQINQIDNALKAGKMAAAKKREELEED